MLAINVDSAKFTYTTASLPRQMLTIKLSTMRFVMIGFDNWKLLVV